MKKIAWVALVLGLLVGADGLYMLLAHYHPQDVNNFNLSDGATVVIAGVLLLVVAAAAFLFGKNTSGQQASARR